MLISDQWVIEEIKEEIKKKIPRDKWKPHNDPKPIGHRKGSSKKEVYSNTILPQETRKISNKQPNLILYLKQPEKEQAKHRQINKDKHNW